MKWIYRTNQSNSCRYVLGINGDNPLICIGLNPSIASPGKLDPTMQSVDRLAKNNGFDSWIMLNLYPKRVTNPAKLPKHLNPLYHQLNMAYFKRCLNAKQNTIWAAWGTLIEIRPYFKRCLRDIKLISDDFPCDWVHIGDQTKAGHPHHPLYLKSTSKPKSFDLDAYIAK